MTSEADQVLCDTPLCFAEIRHIAQHDEIAGPAKAGAETVLCVVDGQAQVVVEFDAQAILVTLSAMQGVQIPSRRTWHIVGLASRTKIFRIDSPHPGHTAATNLMPPLDRVHTFELDSGNSLVYTDYVRGGVLTFAPGFAADKHYHERADELFWFFKGACHVTTADEDAVFPAGTIVYTAPDEWHIIANDSTQPLLMFLAVTPNVVPSHTFFDADGKPMVRSWQPLTRMG